MDCQEVGHAIVGLQGSQISKAMQDVTLDFSTGGRPINLQLRIHLIWSLWQRKREGIRLQPLKVRSGLLASINSSMIGVSMWVCHKGGAYCLSVSNSALQGVDLWWSKSKLQIVTTTSVLYVWTRSAMPSHVSLCSWLSIVWCWLSFELWNGKLNVTDWLFPACEIFSHFETHLNGKHPQQFETNISANFPSKGLLTWYLFGCFVCFSSHITCLIVSYFISGMFFTNAICN